LLAELAKVLNRTAEEYVHAIEADWRAGLPDQRAANIRRRAIVRKETKALELRKEDLVVAQGLPDVARFDLLARYDAATTRKLERTLKALRELQNARRQGKRQR